MCQKCDNLSRVISMRTFIDLLYDPFVCIIHVFSGVVSNTKVQKINSLPILLFQSPTFTYTEYHMQTIAHIL